MQALFQVAGLFVIQLVRKILEVLKQQVGGMVALFNIIGKKGAKMLVMVLGEPGGILKEIILDQQQVGAVGIQIINLEEVPNAVIAEIGFIPM